jgi:hypothetical protein
VELGGAPLRHHADRVPPGPHSTFCEVRKRVQDTFGKSSLPLLPGSLLTGYAKIIFAARPAFASADTCALSGRFIRLAAALNPGEKEVHHLDACKTCLRALDIKSENLEQCPENQHDENDSGKNSGYANDGRYDEEDDEDENAEDNDDFDENDHDWEVRNDWLRYL